jgi:hypothetical protein
MASENGTEVDNLNQHNSLINLVPLFVTDGGVKLSDPSPRPTSYSKPAMTNNTHTFAFLTTTMNRMLCICISDCHSIYLEEPPNRQQRQM